MTHSDLSRNRIAIIGTGLMGGSFGLALHKTGFTGVRVGCDRPDGLKAALAAGAIDTAEEDLGRATAGSDLILLATPVGEILRLLPALKRAAPADALITDTGSTKVHICEEAARWFSDGPLFLGGHPLAGKERSGAENADARLFDNACYVLTPGNAADLDQPRVKSFVRLIGSIGSRVHVMDAAAHDRQMALLSHLPQLASTALAVLAADSPDVALDLAASGFRDATRLADSPYELWRDICSTNAPNIRAALDAYIQKLIAIRDHLSDSALAREFEQAHRLRERLP